MLKLFLFALHSKNEKRQWVQAPQLKPVMQIPANEGGINFIPVRCCLCFPQNAKVSTDGLNASTESI